MKTMDSSNRTIQAVLRPKATVSDKANSVSTFSRTHHKSHPRNSIVRQHAAHTATITPPPPQPRASELSSENLRAATNSPLPSISHISVTPRISLLSHCHTRESRAMNDVQQIQNVHKVMPPTLPFVRVAPSKRLSENGNSYDGARFSNNVESWKRQKNKQQTAQERGFVHKKHNPFSLYKHDPNDTESYLDHLSLRNKETDNESSIPREGLHALVTSSSLQRRRSVQVGTVTASQHHRQHRAGNLESRQREGQLTQTHEVLMQDRAEHNNLRDSAWSNIPNHSVEQTRQFYSVNQPYDSSLCIREPHAGSANLSSRNHEKLYNSPYSHVQHPAQYHEMMFPTQTFPPYTLNTAPRESYQIPHVHEPTWQKQQASWEDMYHGVPQPYGSTSYNGHVTGHPMYSMNNHNIGNAIGYQQTNPYHEMEFADFDEPFI